MHPDSKPLKRSVCPERFVMSREPRTHLPLHNGKAATPDPKANNTGLGLKCRFQLGRDVCNEDIGDEQLQEGRCNSANLIAKPTGHSTSSTQSLRGDFYVQRKTVDKPYKCTLCENSCNWKANMRQHIRRHTGEKPYKCVLCDYAARQQSALITHTKTKHPGIKPLHVQGTTVDKAYKCTVCGYSCNWKSNMVQHTLRHTGEKPCKCVLCDYSARQQSQLITHMKTKHPGIKPFRCTFCLKEHLTPSKLRKHLRLHKGKSTPEMNVSNTKPHVKYRFRRDLNVCQEELHKQKFNRGRLSAANQVANCAEFATTRNKSLSLDFYVHVRGEKVDKPYKCTVCKYSCKTRTDMARHVCIHTGEKPYKCVLCDFGATHSTLLASHMASNHPGIKPFKCTVCHKAHITSCQLRRHMRLHGDHRYKCIFCVFSSQHKGDMQRHTRVHTGEKPFKCTVCNYASTQSPPLSTHMRSKHPGVYPFTCTVCAKGFFRETQLKQHSSLHLTESPRKVSTVDKVRQKPHHDTESLAPGLTLPFHLELRCDVCNKRFETETELSRHLWEIHIGIRLTNKSHDDPVEVRNLKSHQQYANQKKTSSSLSGHHATDLSGPSSHKQGDYSTTTKANLRNHSQHDSGEKEHKAGTYETTLSSNYWSHIEAKDPFNKPVKCMECDQFFLTASQLKQHFRLHQAGVPHSISKKVVESHLNHGTADQPFPLDTESPETISSKEVWDQLRCDVCNKEFDTEVKLSSHLWEDHIGIEHGDKEEIQICADPVQERPQQTVLRDQGFKDQGYLQADPMRNEIRNEQTAIMSAHDSQISKCSATVQNKVKLQQQIVLSDDDSQSQLPTDRVLKQVKHGQGTVNADHVARFISYADSLMEAVKHQQQTAALPCRMFQSHISAAPVPEVAIHQQQTTLLYQVVQNQNCVVPVADQQQTVVPCQVFQNKNSAPPVPEVNKHHQQTAVPYQVYQNHHCAAVVPELNENRQKTVVPCQVLQNKNSAPPIPEHQQQTAVSYRVNQSHHCAAVVPELNEKQQQAAVPCQVFKNQRSFVVPVPEVINHQQRAVLPYRVSQVKSCAAPGRGKSKPQPEEIVVID